MPEPVFGFLFLVEVELLYDVVLVSGGQQSDSGREMYIYRGIFISDSSTL